MGIRSIKPVLLSILIGAILFQGLPITTMNHEVAGISDRELPLIEKSQDLDLSTVIMEGLTSPFQFDPQLELEKDHSALNSVPEWRDMDTEISPSMRDGIELISIEGYGKVIMHGGGHGGAGAEMDTWIYDVGRNEWERHVFENGPGPTSGYAACSIFGTDQMILLGGYSTYLRETRSLHDEGKEKNWVFDLGEMAWAPIQIMGMEEDMRFHHMAPIYGTKKAILYNRLDMRDNSTYVYDHERKEIEKLPIEGVPLSEPGRMSPIHGTDKMLFHWSKINPENVNSWLTGTWIFDYSEEKWTELAIEDGPEYNYHGFNMDMISGTDKVLLFGGGWAGMRMNTTWTFDDESRTWTKMNVSSIPPGRRDHGLVNIKGTTKVMIFGGTDFHDEIGNDTYILDMDRYSSEGTGISEIMEIPGNGVPENLKIGSYRPTGTGIDIMMRAGSKDSISNENFINLRDISTSPIGNGEIILPASFRDDRFFQFSISLSTDTNRSTPYLDSISITYLIERENTPPEIIKLSESFYNTSDSISFRFRLSDEHNDDVDILTFYSLDGVEYYEAEVIYNMYYEPCNLSSGENHSILWKYGSILDDLESESVRFKMIPVDYSAGNPVIFGPYTVDFRSPRPEAMELPEIVGVTHEFTFSFDETINEGSGSSKTAELKDENGIEIPVNTFTSGNYLHVIPYSPLDHGTSYTLMIIRVYDDSGNRIKRITHNFTTEENEPLFIESVDHNGSVLEGTGQFIVNFNRPIPDNQANRAHFKVTDILNRSIQIEVDIQGYTVIVSIKGSAPEGLDYYLLTVGRGITDDNLNILEEDDAYELIKTTRDPENEEESGGDFWYTICLTPVGILLIAVIFLKMFGKGVIRSLIRNQGEK